MKLWMLLFGDRIPPFKKIRRGGSYRQNSKHFGYPLNPWPSEIMDNILPYQLYLTVHLSLDETEVKAICNLKLAKNLLCYVLEAVSGNVSDPDLIRSVNPDPGSESSIRIQESKRPQNSKTLGNFMDHYFFSCKVFSIFGHKNHRSWSGISVSGSKTLISDFDDHETFQIWPNPDPVHGTASWYPYTDYGIGTVRAITLRSLVHKGLRTVSVFLLFSLVLNWTSAP